MTTRRIVTVFFGLTVAALAMACGTEGSGGNGNTVTLGTSCFMFEAGKEGDFPTSGDCDLILEPWCNGRPGLCGNWVQTAETSLDAVATPPASGYISDAAGFQDCQEIDSGKVIVFKLSNGKYAKGIFSAVSKDGNGCVTGAKFQYVYPM
ncbi:MAG: hypothetical protein GXP54_08015 [Deltaproteobacteria bacterium]|nr:hypothetical protein [Deltaproteobacteria bacterium]